MADDKKPYEPSLEIGGDADVVEQDVPNTTKISVLDVVATAKEPIPAIFYTKGSLAGPGSMLPSVVILAKQDSKEPNTVYGPYVETEREVDAHPDTKAQGLEISLIDLGNSANINPYDVTKNGLSEALRLGAGKPGSNSKEISAALVIANVEGTPTSKFRKGIIIGGKAIQTPLQAICLAQGQGITWFLPDGTPGPHFRSDVSQPNSGMRMIFFDGGFALQNSAGVNVLIAWNDNTVSLCGQRFSSVEMTKLKTILNS